MLTDEAHRARGPYRRFDFLKLSGLALLAKCYFEFIRAIEIVLNRTLISPGDEDYVLDAGG